MASVQTIVDPFGIMPRATRAGGRVLGSAGDAAGRITLRTLERTLASPRTEEAVDLIVSRLLATGLPERIADQLLAGGVAERVIDRVLASPDLHRIITHVLDSPQVSVLTNEILESEGMERLVAQVIDSRLVDSGMAHVLEGDDLWILIEEIAHSPAVTEAISHQGAGLADHVAEEVGRRSRRADARLERAARRLFHRPPPADTSSAVATPGS